MNLPKTLSIITITYRAENFLKRTLASVAHQTCRDFEHLIIDGLSPDKTLEIAASFKSQIPEMSVFSEKDAGLYDAMNKGLKKAKGKYVWFLNAGDTISDTETIQNLVDVLSTNPDVVYSDTMLVDESGLHLGLRSKLTPHKIKAHIQWTDYKFGMLICHQSFIPKTELCGAYDTSNFSADIDWEINILKKAQKTVLLPFVLSNYLMGGASAQNKIRSLKDRQKVFFKHFGSIQSCLSALFILIRGVLFKLKRSFS